MSDINNIFDTTVVSTAGLEAFDRLLNDDEEIRTFLDNPRQSVIQFIAAVARTSHEGKALSVRMLLKDGVVPALAAGGHGRDVLKVLSVLDGDQQSTVLSASNAVRALTSWGFAPEVLSLIKSMDQNQAAAVLAAPSAFYSLAIHCQGAGKMSRKLSGLLATLCKSLPTHQFEAILAADEDKLSLVLNASQYKQFKARVAHCSVISDARDPRNIGLVHVGRSGDDQHLLVEPQDVKEPTTGQRLRMTFDEASTHAKADGMEIPSIDELEVLYALAKTIGGFDCSRDGYYWSSSEGDPYGGPFTLDGAWARNFADGEQFGSSVDGRYFVRRVRRCAIV